MKQIKMLLLASMVVLFTACGGGSSGSNTENVVVDDVSDGTIDSSGGTIELSNGARLTVPPGSAATTTEVLFEWIDVPEFVGEEDVKAYQFVTSSELADSNFVIPVELDGITNEEDLMVVHMSGEGEAADSISFTYDAGANTVSFSIKNNWTFQYIKEPLKQESATVVQTDPSPSSSADNVIYLDNMILIIKNPEPQITPSSDKIVIDMPFYKQSGGTCWATAGKMLSKGFYSRTDAALRPASIYGLMRKLGRGIDDGLPPLLEEDFIEELGHGINLERYFYFESVLKKIIEEIEEGHPLLFGTHNHMVMVVGYEVDTEGNIALIQNDSAEWMYEEQLWTEIVNEIKETTNPLNWVFGSPLTLMWSETSPDPDRPLQSVGIPSYGTSTFGDISFEGLKTALLPSVEFHLKFDETLENGYHWSKGDTGEQTDKFTANVNTLHFNLPIYDAGAGEGERHVVRLNVTVWQDNNTANNVMFSQDQTIYRNNVEPVQGALDLTPLQKNLAQEEKFTVEIALDTKLGTTTIHRFKDFYLQPNITIDSCITGKTWDNVYRDYNCDAYGDSLISNASMTFIDNGTWTGVGPGGTQYNGDWQKKYGTEEWVYIYHSNHDDGMMIGGIWSTCKKMQIDLVGNLKSIYGADCLVFTTDDP